MLPKAHLTSHSSMSGSRWVITPLWLFGSWRYFLYSSFVYSCRLFLISSASVRPLPFLSFINKPVFAWNVPLVCLIFLKRSLSFPFYCFPLFLCIDCWGRLSYLLAILWSSAFKWVYLSLSPLRFTSLLFTAICKASSDNRFAFLHFFSLGMLLILPPVQCYKPLSIVLQALLSDLISWIYLSLALYNCKAYDLHHTWMV